MRTTASRSDPIGREACSAASPFLTAARNFYTIKNFINAMKIIWNDMDNRAPIEPASFPPEDPELQFEDKEWLDMLEKELKEVEEEASLWEPEEEE